MDPHHTARYVGVVSTMSKMGSLFVGVVMEEDVKAQIYFRSCIRCIFKALRFSCSPATSKDFILHQTELLHMLSSWTREHAGVTSIAFPFFLCLYFNYVLQPCLTEEQWRAVLLFAIFLFSDQLLEKSWELLEADTALEATLGAEKLVPAHIPLRHVPSSPAVREKVVPYLFIAASKFYHFPM